MAEFLPLCDVLFNVISLAGYFCDVVFDVVLGYALYERQKFTYFAAVIVIVSFSLIISQIVSIRWYLNKRKLRSSTTATTGPPHEGGGPESPQSSLEKKKKKPPVKPVTKAAKYSRYAVLALHATQLGVLWRYAKLFVPVDLRHVKHEVRDLCMLRLVHAFCEAAPMLLLQLYVLVNLQNENHLNALKLKALASGHHLSSTSLVQQTSLAEQQQKTFRDLNMVSATLSLFSVCWALASFSKNVRLQNVHRLVLTWLGVIFQFLWRLGTVISRVISLTVYASVYSQWVFLVIILHWFSMFLWLISPKNVFHGERISRLKKAMLGGLIAFVYIFAYINLQEVRHRQKMLTFYVVMFMENCLLVGLWMVGIWPNRPDGWYTIPISVLCSFAIGLFFMVVYYRYFHVRRLGYEAGGRVPCEDGSSKCHHCADVCRCRENLDHVDTGKNFGGCGSQKYPHAIPGVFNCRFSNPVNAATKRKKKKPTTFVPPPNLAMQPSGTEQAAPIGPMAIPFWRRPLPRSHTGGSSENEGSSVGSRVNIQQKLQEKKQKQLAELKIIEEEIKQGKLGGPGTGTLSSGDDGKATLPRQPIPRVKKHIDIDPMEWRPSSPDIAEIAVEKSFNDLNLLLAANLDDVNNLNKFNSNYDPIYNSFGLNGINISALVNMKNAEAQQAAANNRNMSPISSQISATESNSLTRQVHPRSKMLPNNVPRNPFAENYRGNFVNLYADAAANSHRPPSISPRTTEVATANRAVLYDNHSRLYMDANHPRQISGTYSSIENAGTENLPFPYNVVPPPRSKLDSRATPTMPNNTSATNTGSSSGKNNIPKAPVGSVNIPGAPAPINNLNQATKRQMQRAKTPEILLAPHYLENSRIYYDWVAREAANFRLQEADRNQSVVSSGDENLDAIDDGHNPHRIPSDIDSQVSLPRSYTLPREFKYYRRNKGRKVIKNEHFIASTNSSDGDVDSGDDNESEHHSNISNGSQQRSKNATPSSNLGAAQRLNNLNKSPTTVPYGHNISPSATMLAAANSRQTLNATPQSMVHSLDLINGVVDSVSAAAAANGASGPVSYSNNRPMRLRMYGAKNGMVRHETKL